MFRKTKRMIALLLTATMLAPMLATTVIAEEIPEMVQQNVMYDGGVAPEIMDLSEEESATLAEQYSGTYSLFSQFYGWFEVWYEYDEYIADDGTAFRKIYNIGLTRSYTLDG